ncbi:MAG TPA: hypothetical protein DIV86_05700, partial [Alphaproteobacteria bacterium]|nr:hypothetical protein [Alphaproteobacteria bacterium]
MKKHWKDKLIKEGFIVSVSGMDENNIDTWAIAIVKYDKYFEFKTAENGGGGYFLEDFGEVLASGEGVVPPKEILDKLKKEYDIS